MVELWVIQMKNNILNHFAFNDLKNHKTDTIVSFMTLTCLSFIMLMVTFLSPLLLNLYDLEYKETFGYYDYESEHELSKDEILNDHLTIDGQDYLFKDAPILYTLLHHIGTTLTEDSIDYIEGDLTNLAVNISEGRLPEHENELAVKKEVLRNLGYESSLNQNISIPYYFTDENNEENYGVIEGKIVGFLAFSGNSSVITGDYQGADCYQVYLRNQQHRKVLSEKIQLLAMNEVFQTRKGLDTLVVMIEFILFIIGNVIASGLTIASFQNRQKDYTLLRGLGATKRQLYYVVFLQTVFIGLCAFALASVLYVVAGLCCQTIFQSKIVLEFYFEYYIGIGIIILLTSFISYFIPARASCRRALTGSFESNEFQYFYYRYKKLHQMRPLYLGWRQLVGRKKQMFVKIFLIFIVCLFTMIMIGNKFDQEDSISKKKSDAQNRLQTTEISIKYQLENLNQQNDLHFFDVYQQYAKEIFYMPYIEMEENRVQVYSYNDDTKKAFHLDKELKSGEIIASQTYRNEGDTLSIGNQEYTIVESIPGNTDFVIMNQEDYQQYDDLQKKTCIQINFANIHDKTNGYLAFAKQKDLKGYYQCKDSLLMAMKDIDSWRDYSIHSLSYISTVIIVGASVIYVYQLAYEIMKDKENIGTYQLLGFQKREIWMIYASKSLFIAMIGFVCAVYYHFVSLYMNNVDGNWPIYITSKAIREQIGIPILIIIVLISLSLLTIYSILRKDGLENKQLRE